MPSSMVHLLAAYKYNSEASIEFLIGNIVPDIIKGWKEKDRNHLRDREDRLEALTELADTMDLRDDYNRGILFHLFLDYKWDIDTREEFIKSYEGFTWFEPYRHEIALSGAWLYRHTDWSERVWKELMSYPLVNLKSDEYDKNELERFIARNYSWHKDNDIGPSLYFTPEIIEEFTSRVAVEFNDWLEEINRIDNSINES